MRTTTLALLLALATSAPFLAPLAAPSAARAETTGEDVTIETSDGLTLRGTYWAPEGKPTGAPCVVALHMYRSNRAAWEPLAGPVTKRGCALLAIDMRGHGDSREQDGEDLGEKVATRDAELFNAMHLDAEAAVTFARRTKKAPRGRVALVGASVGCSVAIHAATKKPLDVSAVAVLTPGKSYLGVPTMEHVKRWYRTLPLRIFSSEEERGRGADAIHEALRERGAELTIVPGTSIHGTRMFGVVPGIEDDLATWLTTRILGPIPDGVIEDSETDGAITAGVAGRDVFVRFAGGRLYVASRWRASGDVQSDRVRLRVTDAADASHEVPDDRGMGMSRIDMSIGSAALSSTAVTEWTYLPAELGAAPGDTIGLQLSFTAGDDDPSPFGPDEPLRVTLE